MSYASVLIEEDILGYLEQVELSTDQNAIDFSLPVQFVKISQSGGVKRYEQYSLAPPQGNSC